MNRDAGGERDLTDPLARGSLDKQRTIGAGRDLQIVGLQSGREPLGIGAADADGAAGARGQLCERGLDHEPPAADDQHLIDGLRDLREHVA